MPYFCPDCRLWHPDTAVACEKCGMLFDHAPQNVDASPLSVDDIKARRQGKTRDPWASDEWHAEYARTVPYMVKGVAFAFFGAFMLGMMSNIWQGGARFLFWCVVAVMAFDIISFVGAIGGTVALAATKAVPMGWPWACLVTRGIGTVLYVVALWVAARGVGY